jgi:predicted Zn-ribbon and HTH transcriptional regulator
MFRKRFVRPKGKDFGPTPHPLLQRANELMAISDFTGAARAYEELAQAAQARTGPAAPHLYMQAGKARLLAGQVPIGIVHIKQGLSLFAGRGEWLKFYRNRRRTVEELLRLGLNGETDALATYLSAELPAGIQEDEAKTRDNIGRVERRKAVLPPKCQGCGAPLRSDEVEWVDEVSAECPYCGSISRSLR